MTSLARTTVLAIFALVLVHPLVAADPHGDCDSKGQPALGVVAIETPVVTIYVDDRNYLLGNGIWVYRECNGEPGLQRGGSGTLVPDDSEICYDDSPMGPDCTII